MGRRKKLIKVRKPKVRITSKGVKLTRPTARIGGKAGINLSSSGMSASYRTKLGTISTGRATRKRGRSPSCLGCALTTLLFCATPVAVGLHLLSKKPSTDSSLVK